MRTFKTAYEFYKLPQRERKHLIDQSFKEEGRDVLYFPIGLTLEGSYSNYNRKQGVISVHPLYVIRSGVDKGKPWFKLGAFSPDDYDLDLEFRGEEATEEKRNLILAYLKTANKRNTTYVDFLNKVKDLFGGDIG